MSYQLHLVPELHLPGVVPVAQVTVDEQDDQGQHDGQDLSRQTDVTPREERQSKHSKQHLQQHQGDLSSHDVVQVGQLILFTVLEGVHLVGERGVSVLRPDDTWSKVNELISLQFSRLIYRVISHIGKSPPDHQIELRFRPFKTL